METWWELSLWVKICITNGIKMFGHMCILEMGNILGPFFMHTLKNNGCCNNMLNRLHVLYIHVSTNCQEDFLLAIEYI